jgi:hypothetical protein
VLWRLRVLKRKRCQHCTGILGDDGRAEFPVERLECCAWCGDTWEAGKRKYVGPGYRDDAKDLLAALRDLPPAPKEGDLVDIDAVFERLKPQGPDVCDEMGRPIPGPGKSRLGMSAFYAPDINEHGALTPNGLRKVLNDPQSALPTRSRRGRS